MSIQLNDSLVNDILAYLGCPPKAPTLQYLNRLIHAYVRRVPWESVSRIVRRHTTASTADCPRWPAEFWHDAMHHGFGGTCYESSLAFYSLLASLGYEGYLTVNDMGETRGCHAANVVLLNGSKYLVDVTIPLHAAIRINPGRTTRRATAFHNYTLRPVRENAYEVERSHHAHKNAFTFIDAPVSLADYQAIVIRDYGDTGYFLRSVAIVKVIDDQVWRFFSDHQPYKLERFNRGGKHETLVPPETLAPALAGLFQLPQERVGAALTYINSQSG